MISATQQLHNLGQNLWLGCRNPVLRPKDATGMAVQAAGSERRTAISTSPSTLSKPMSANLGNGLKRGRAPQGKEDRN